MTCVFGGVLFYYFKESEERLRQTEKAGLRDYLRRTLPSPVQFQNSAELRKILSPFLINQFKWVAVHAADGSLIYTDGDLPELGSHVSAAETSVHQFSLPISVGDSLVGGLSAEIRLEPYLRRRNEFLIFFGVAIALSFVASAMGLQFALAQILTRIVALSKYIKSYSVARKNPPPRELTEDRDEVTGIYEHFTEAFRREQELSIHAAMFQQASQVAHDIRGPAFALNAIAASRNLPAKEKQLLVEATERIKKIAEDLLTEAREIQPKEFILKESLLRIIQEKSLVGNFASIDWSSDEGITSVMGDPSKFERILSNILNNAFEASVGTSGTPEVRIVVNVQEGVVEISVQDKGVGIPKEVLSKIGQRGFSFGKKDGNGLGVHEAITQLRAWGGDLKIESEPGRGTRVCLILRRLPVVSAEGSNI